MKEKNIRVSLFIKANLSNVYKAKDLNADCVEFHTGEICNLINKGKNYKNLFLKFYQAINLANSIGIEIHAGHGMNYKSAKILKKLKKIKEFNIGHFIIGESIFYGLSKVIKNFKNG